MTSNAHAVILIEGQPTCHSEAVASIAHVLHLTDQRRRILYDASSMYRALFNGELWCLQVHVPDTLQKALQEAMKDAGIPTPDTEERWQAALKAMKVSPPPKPTPILAKPPVST